MARRCYDRLEVCRQQIVFTLNSSSGGGLASTQNLKLSRKDIMVGGPMSVIFSLNLGQLFLQESSDKFNRRGREENRATMAYSDYQMVAFGLVRINGMQEKCLRHQKD